MEITSSKIAEQFDLQEIGKTKLITHYSTPESFDDESIGWAKSEMVLNNFNNGTVIAWNEHFKNIDPSENCTYLLTKNSSPRLQFAKILKEYFTPNAKFYLDNEVKKHALNNEIYIGENVFIGRNVTIGKGTIIHPNVCIYANTIIGENCIIANGVSIGTEGLGLEMDPENQLYFKFPQLGGVIIEDFVEIGPSSTVRRAALNNTIIRKGTKIGALVNVGHNCEIGQNCILTCNNVLAGSSKLGNDVFMGVSSILKTGVQLGDAAQIGMGAVVTKNVPNGETWIGNPARKLK